MKCPPWPVVPRQGSSTSAPAVSGQTPKLVCCLTAISALYGAPAALEFDCLQPRRRAHNACAQPAHGCLARGPVCPTAGQRSACWLSWKKLVQLKRRSHVARFDVVKDGTSIVTRAGLHSPNQAHTCRASLASSSARRWANSASTSSWGMTRPAATDARPAATWP